MKTKNETKEKTPFGEQYTYKTIEEYENIVGYKMNDAFQTGWRMARMRNKHFGFMEEENKNE